MDLGSVELCNVFAPRILLSSVATSIAELMSKLGGCLLRNVDGRPVVVEPVTRVSVFATAREE